MKYNPSVFECDAIKAKYYWAMVTVEPTSPRGRVWAGDQKFYRTKTAALQNEPANYDMWRYFSNRGTWQCVRTRREEDQ
jgi:hypothetical protein